MSGASEAWIFPGQGSHAPQMVEGCRGMRTFEAHIGLLDELAGHDVLARLDQEGEGYLNRNETAAALTVLVSATHLAEMRQERPAPARAAGYSVGQWTALVAAEACSLETALRAVWARSQYMNAALAGRRTGMSGVVGLTVEVVDDICSRLSSDGRVLAVSNVNAPGNISVAGDVAALDDAAEAFRGAGAYRVVPLPVSGAWHSPILRSAVSPFRSYLDQVELRSPQCPVMDNITGGVLPVDRPSLLHALAEHVAAPVRWLDCVRSLLTDGVGRFIEIGHGDMLTRFGRFTDRTASFESYPALARVPRGEKAPHTALSS